jgi:hypothetical protein
MLLDRVELDAATAIERLAGMQTQYSPSRGFVPIPRNTRSAGSRLRWWRPGGKPGNLRPVPDLSHLWQRFLLASSLVVGLAIGAAVTVFGYSNLGTVDVRWSILHINGVPMWTVAVVPLALVLIAGTIYHWMDGLHHFTEHMRHRRRVHELEVEVASLRAHLDQVLEMPDQATSRLPAKHTVADSQPEEDVAEIGPAEIAALPEPAAADAPPPNGSASVANRRSRKRATLVSVNEPGIVSSAPANGAVAGKEDPAETPSSPESEA